jgi:hypothetical protein
LPKYWILTKDDEFQTNLHLVLPSDILILPMRVLESQFGLVLIEDEDWYEEETD